VNPVPGGTSTFTFANGNNAKFDYTVQLAGRPSPMTQTQIVTRQVFTQPGTIAIKRASTVQHRLIHRPASACWI